MPSYEATETGFMIHDPVWGDCLIGDQPGDEVLLELLDNDLVRRSMAIEQLTLSPLTETIPGTASFSRWEHIWGSVALVRHLAEGMDITPRERLIFQLRTFVSDLGHTAYSHLGDWLFQGVGGQENQHDIELMKMLEMSGVADILRKHEVQPDEVVFPDIEDWVECSAPELCVDRVDYGAREIKRWPIDSDSSMVASSSAFKLIEGKIVMPSHQAALVFAKSFLLLATEHWSEPVHRLQLRLQEMLVQDVLRHEYLGLISIDMGNADMFHPRDLLYAVDGDITREMYLFGGLGSTVMPIMDAIGLARRRVYVNERREQLGYFKRNDTDEYPNPVEHYDYFGQRIGKLALLPSFIEVVPVEKMPDGPEYGDNPNSLDVFLPALKPRFVDPTFVDKAGNQQRLSAFDDKFAALLSQQARYSEQAYIARVFMNADTKSTIVERVTENKELWAKAVQRPRMSTEVFRRMLHNTTSVAAGYSMINLYWTR